MQIVVSIIGVIVLFFMVPILIVSVIKAPLGIEIKVIIFSGFLLASLIAGLLLEQSDTNQEQETEKLYSELIGDSGMSTAKQWLIIIVLQGVITYVMYYWAQS